MQEQTALTPRRAHSSADVEHKLRRLESASRRHQVADIRLNVSSCVTSMPGVVRAGLSECNCSCAGSGACKAGASGAPPSTPPKHTSWAWIIIRDIIRHRRAYTTSSFKHHNGCSNHRQLAGRKSRPCDVSIINSDDGETSRQSTQLL